MTKGLALSSLDQSRHERRVEADRNLGVLYRVGHQIPQVVDATSMKRT